MKPFWSRIPLCEQCATFDVKGTDSDSLWLRIETARRRARLQPFEDRDQRKGQRESYLEIAFPSEREKM